LQATAINDTQVELTWNNVLGEETYRIERRIDGTSTWTVAGSTAANVTIYVNSALLPSTTYVYRVSAVNPEGTVSTPSSEVRITTAPADTIATITLTPTAAQVTVAWTGTIADKRWHDVQRKLHSDPVTSFTTVNAARLPATQVSYIDTTVLSGTEYDYRLMSYNDAVTTVGIPSLTQVTYTLLTAPLNLRIPTIVSTYTGNTVPDVTSTSVHVLWDAVANAV